MTLHAVGAYLQVRRKTAGLTQEQVARHLGVTARTISEWETGGSGPSFELMARFTALIQASIEDAQRLLLDQTATAEQGRELARQSARHAAQQMSDEELNEVIGLFERLRNNPQALERWFGYGDRLAEERGADVQPQVHIDNPQDAPEAEH